MLHDCGLRVFWIAGKHDLNNWGYLTRIVRHWNRIEEMLTTRGPGPWFMEVHDTRVTEFQFPRGAP